MERVDLNDLLVFATIAKEKSFTRAAARMGLTPSALSHTMRAMEQRLGVKLLSRTTRSVAPTEAGQRLLQSLEPAFSHIEAGLEALSAWRDAPMGNLRITTFSVAAHTVLARKLPRFLSQNPGIRVEIDVDDALTDIVAGGFDAGIRFGSEVEKDMIAVRVGPDTRCVVVATPDYFARYPAPTRPAELHSHNCIGYRLTGGGLLSWDFARDGEKTSIKSSGQMVVNDGPLALMAVRAGAGIGYLMEEDVSDDIANGRLIQVLSDWCPTFPGCYLYYPSRRQQSHAMRMLIAALRHE